MKNNYKLTALSLFFSIFTSFSQTNETETFNSGTVGSFWTNSGWSLSNTGTPSSYTGPSTLHDGYFLYAESSNYVAGTEFILTSNTFTGTVEQFSFYYNMYGYFTAASGSGGMGTIYLEYTSDGV